MRWEDALIEDIRFHDERDDRDWPFELVFFPEEEFSQCNREHLATELKQASPKTILEIGVARNDAKSSSIVFIEKKDRDTAYIGVDIDDKSFLNDVANNVYTMRIDSSQIDLVMDRVELLTGRKEIDFLFIDGLHSINQVLLEWEYTRYLSAGGVVGFHDTNKHPGPSRFINALDKNKFDIRSYCIDNDNGIAFVQHKDQIK